ncbi:MAG: prolyl oligopeptidase family serine peptidase [Planctomycetales bacterium]|nr:prolyl oligopeptidase family serine peptidase [Planctomycetales bacterium]
MVSHDVSQTVEAMTQAVQDIRCAAAWLAAQPEVDTTQLGITGISLGGIVSALVAEAEPRIGNVLPVLAGGKFGATAWESDELRGSREFWESQGLTADKLAEMVRDVDPVTHAQNLRGRRMLMINAKRDRVIPPHCAEALWSAAGKPPIIWWNTTHYSAAWRLPEGISRMVQFFSPLEAAGTTFVSPPAERAQKQQPE